MKESIIEQEKLVKKLGLPKYSISLVKDCYVYNVFTVLNKLAINGYLDTKGYLTDKGRQLYTQLMDLEENISQEELDNLYVKMKELYPVGTKNGTSTSWRGNPISCTNKLRTFFKKYGRYSDEEILTATKNYINKFNRLGDRSYMRVLPYFILKTENGEEKSDLADELEKLKDSKNQHTTPSVDIDSLDSTDNYYDEPGSKLL